MVFSSLFKSQEQRSAKQSATPSADVVDNQNLGKEEAKSSKSRRKRRNKRKAGSTVLEPPVATVSVESKAINLAAAKQPDEDRTSEKWKRPRTKGNNKWKPPSTAALDLSARLKEHSRHKRLQDALDLYWDKANDSIRDGHHGCIVVDCCSRCGATQEGENVIQEMGKSGMHVNVETKTALMKGYAHAGQLHKAMSLFETMCAAKAKRDLPNVRTFNTLLRGCLWTAATENEEGVVAGGVVSSEAAWALFQRTCRQRLQDECKVDLSSYEYSVTLLCQALRAKEAEDRVEDFKRTFRVSETVESGAMESLAVCYQSLARMYVLLQDKEEVKRAVKSGLKAVDEAFQHVSKAGNDAKPDGEGNAKRVLEGGKQAWRRNAGDTELGEESRRSGSNTLFRNHRLREIKDDLLAIRQWCESERCLLSPRAFLRHLFSRLYIVSGGGSTELTVCDGNMDSHPGQSDAKEDHYLRLIRNQWASFGLRVALENARYKGPLPGNQSDLTHSEAKKVQHFASFHDEVVSTDGCFNFQRIFQSEAENFCNSGTPLDIELGSGFGEWIVQQASKHPARYYVAVELRSDRVAQIFSKAFAARTEPPLNNLCVVGSEGGNFLRNHVKKDSVSTIFVNHPEPPTQTYGAEGVVLQRIMEGHLEPAHMLNRRTIVAAASCLHANESARLVIVTDNRWHARLICATLVSVIRENRGLLQSLKSDSGKESGLRAIETFRLSDSLPANAMDQVVLFQGHPGENIGHSVGNRAGVSYFDKLWKSGAGKHAEQSSRFIIVMHRISSNTGRSPPDEHRVIGSGSLKRKPKQANKAKKRARS